MCWRIVVWDHHRIPAGVSSLQCGFHKRGYSLVWTNGMVAMIFFSQLGLLILSSFPHTPFFSFSFLSPTFSLFPLFFDINDHSIMCIFWDIISTDTSRCIINIKSSFFVLFYRWVEYLSYPFSFFPWYTTDLLVFCIALPAIYMCTYQLYWFV